MNEEVEQLKAEVYNLQAVVAQLESRLSQDAGSDIIRPLLPDTLDQAGGGDVTRGEPELYKAVTLRHWVGDVLMPIGGSGDSIPENELFPTYDWLRAK